MSDWKSGEYDADELVLEHQVDQHEETDAADFIPVRVVVVDSVVTQDIIPQHVDTFTVVLTDDEPVQQLMAYDPLRFRAEVAALDADVVLCHSFTQAKDPANLEAGAPMPNGAVLKAPGTGVVPLYVDVTTVARMWVAKPAAVGNARVSVILKRRAV